MKNYIPAFYFILPHKGLSGPSFPAQGTVPSAKNQKNRRQPALLCVLFVILKFTVHVQPFAFTSNLGRLS